MSDIIGALEARLCQYFGRRYCIVTGRCTTAIYATLCAFDVAPSKAVLSAVSNPSPANAALYAGIEPVFCDIHLTDFNVDISSLEKLIDQEEGIRVIIAVHLFGQPADMDKILQLAKIRGLYVIEDLAQAMGGRYRGKRLGSFGDVAVVSFAHTKIIDVGIGGAALTDDGKLADRIRTVANRLPPAPNRVAQMAEEYRKVYYTLKSLTEVNPRLNELFVPLPGIYRGMYLFKAEDEIADKVLKEIDKLDEYVSARKRNALAYQTGLDHPNIIHPVYKEEGVFWRYSFLIKGNNQQTVCDKMRHQGFDISNWYPPLHRWYESGRKQDEGLFKNANYFADHVCNLWTEPSQSSKRIRSTVQALLRVLVEESPRQ